MKNEIIAKVKDAIGKTTQKVVKFSGDAVDYTKLRIRISEINSQLDEKYAAIGLAVFEENEEIDVDAICAEIAALREELSSIKLKLDDFRNKKICPECGLAAEKEFPYCPGCGNKF